MRLVRAMIAAAMGLALTGCMGSQTTSSTPTNSVTTPPTAQETGAVKRSASSAQSTSVTVPLQAQETDIIGAYDILHQLGLRVEVTRQVAVASLAVPSVSLSPQAGVSVVRGSTIAVTPEPGPLGSPAVLTSHPHYRVPDFRGRPLSTAIAWCGAHQMFWSIPSLPALPASGSPHLFDAYRIVGQQPRPGDTLGQGVAIGSAFEPTPLTLIVVRG